MISISVLLVAFVGVGWYAFNYYTERMIQELAANMDELPMENNTKDNDLKIQNENIESNSQVDISENENVNVNNSEQNQQDQKTPTQPPNTTTNKQNGQKEGEQKTEQKIEVTADEINEKSKAVTTKDKLTAAEIIFSNLTKEDINRIRDLSSGGFTSQEKQVVKSILLSRLSSEEYQQIYAMVKKYR